MPHPLLLEAEAAVRAFREAGGDGRSRHAAIAACARLIEDPAFASLPVAEQRFALNSGGVLGLQRFEADGDPEDLARAVACLEAGVATGHAETAADLAVFHGNLALALAARFALAGDLADLSRAAHCYEAIVETAPPEFARARAGFLTRLVRLFDEHAGALTGQDLTGRRMRAIALLLDALEPAPETVRQRGALLADLAGALLNWSDHCPPERRAGAVERAAEANREGAALLRAAGDAAGVRICAETAERIERMRELLASLARAERVERTVDAGDLLDRITAIERPDVRRAEFRKVLAQISAETAGPAWVMFTAALGEDILEDRAAAPADLDEAVACFEAALAHLGTAADPAVTAAVLHDHGIALTRGPSGDRDEHLERAVASLEAALSILPSGTPLRYTVTAGLAGAYQDRVRGDAAANIEHGIGLCEGVLADQGRDTAAAAARAGVRNRLGRLYLARIEGGRADNVETALGHLHAAAEGIDADADPYRLADVRHNLGVAFRERLSGGREENLWVAIGHFRACLALYPRQTLPVDWADAQVALGNAYGLLRGRDAAETRAQAVTAYLAALEVFTREDAPFKWASVHASMGSMYADTEVGDTVSLERAAGYLRAALEVLTEDHSARDWAFANAALGGALLDLPGDGNAEAAGRHLRTALRACSPRVHPVLWAEIRLNLMMRVDGAVDLDDYRTAVGILHQNGAWSDIVKAGEFMADHLAARGEWAEAARVGEGALKALDLVRRGAVLRETRHVDGSAGGALLEATAVAMVRAGRPADAALLLEDARARELAEGIVQAEADLARLGEAAPRERAAYEEASAQVREAERMERAATSRPMRQAFVREDEAERLRVVGAILHARRRLAGVLDRIRLLPGFDGFPLPPAPAGLAGAVAPGRPLAYLLCGPGTGLILLATAREDGGVRVEAHEVPLTRRALDGLLDPVLTAEAGPPHAFGEALTRACEAVGRDLAAPLARLLREAGARAVTLVPCGRLPALPVHAAPFGASDGTCLIDAFDVYVAPSARAAAACAGRAAAAGGRVRRLAGVADPTGDLPYARGEAAAITALLDAPGTRIATGGAAGAAALSAGLADASHVHLACHGAFDHRRPLRSALILAGGERLTLGRILDGRAFAGVRLVVASACTTAVTDGRHPDEAVGLATGLVQAGAAGVVASLWRVGDLATMLLMTRYYAALSEADHSCGTCLRRAQLWLRDATAAEATAWLDALCDRVPEGPGREALAEARDRTALAGPETRPFAHPRHWAAFVHLGA